MLEPIRLLNIAPDASRPLWRKQLAFIDTETTGLDPARHEVIEVAIAITSGLTEYRSNRDELPGPFVHERFHRVCRPLQLNLQDEGTIEAFSFNGFDERLEELQQADLLGAHHEDLARLLGRESIVIGSNPRFDLQMLASSMARQGHQLNHCRCIDIGTVGYLFVPGIRSFGLASLYEAMFGEEVPGHHGAMADVDATIQVFFAVMQQWLDGMKQHAIQEPQ